MNGIPDFFQELSDILTYYVDMWSLNVDAWPTFEIVPNDGRYSISFK